MKNILIVGGQGTFLDELYHKLSREGNRVAVLTNAHKQTLRQREYHYAYDSDSVREVMDSCTPDTVLFMGAFDTSFQWNARTEQNDYKAYVAGISNILRCAEKTGVQQFVYLSSECVFEDDYLTPVNETMPPRSRSSKSIAVALGESLVTSYAGHQRLDTVTVRLAHLYMTPANANECTDVYTKMCLQAASTGQIEINAKIQRSALYLSDAVQALMLLLSATAHSQPLYHVSSNEIITEDDVAHIIRSISSRHISIADRTVGMERCILLSDQYFNQEFGFEARHKLQDCLPKIMQQMQENIRQYTTGDPSASTGEGRSRLMKLIRRLIPFFEALLVFILVLLAEIFLSDQSFFEHVDFFLLYVLLFSLIHGLHLSIFTASLSVAGYFITELTGDNHLKLLMDVGTYVWIAQIFIIGMSVGHLRDRLMQLQSDKDDEISYLSTRLGDISAINKGNVAIKNYFEQQTINSTESLGFFYDIVAQLDAANENEVMFVAVQLLAQVMHTTDAAIYAVSKSGFLRLLTTTTSRAYDMGKSIRISDYQNIMDTLEKDYIFVNRTMDEHLPNMVSVIKNDEGEIETLIFLWDLPYERMTLQYSNTLRILTLLIRSAVERTTHYLKALTHERYWKNTNVLQATAFRDILQVYENAAQKKLADYALLRIKGGVSGVNDLNQMSEMLRKPLRKTDYINHMDQQLYRQIRQLDFIGYMEDASFYILLTNTSREEARIVVRRLADNGLSASVVNELP